MKKPLERIRQGRGSSGAVPADGHPLDPRDLTPAECDIIRSQHERQIRSLAPKIKVSKVDGIPTVLVDHPNETLGTMLMMNALGTSNTRFSGGILSQLVNVACQGQDVSATEINFILAMVNGIGPKDETEAMLASQMAAIHNATMTAARRLAHVDSLQQQDSASTMLNKLARTFAAQVEALKRYRSTGEQSIRVQHVTVNEGGQAVVGDIHQTRGGADEKGSRQSHEPCAPLAPGTPMPCHIETDEATVRSTSGAEQDRVPVSRGSGGSTKGRG